MRIWAAIIVLAASQTITGCVQSTSAAFPEPALAVHATAKCDGALEPRYFPEAALRSMPADAYRFVKLPALLLEAMHEPSFACGSVPESYRVLWMHSFSSWPRPVSNHPPTMIRVSNDGHGWTATAVRLAGSLNRTEIERRSRPLNVREVQQMREALEEFRFWVRADYDDTPGPNDGAMWIVEGRRGTAYHPVVNPDGAGVQKLMLSLVRLAGTRPGRIDPEGDR
jgi:hypothetical protein